jgi:hypothetical protein
MPAIVTMSPTERPCAAAVEIVTVVPDSVAPGTASVTVPPPEVASPEVGFVYWNDLVLGTAVTVNVPLYPATPTPATVTVSPTCRVCDALVAIVTVLPFSSAPPREVALGAALIVRLSGWIVAARE